MIGLGAQITYISNTTYNEDKTIDIDLKINKFLTVLVIYIILCIFIGKDKIQKYIPNVE